MADWLRLRHQKKPPKRQDNKTTIWADASGTLMQQDEDGASTQLGAGGPPNGGSQPQPDDIPDLALWLDASTLTLADDDPVETWPDASGNGWDATQAAGVNEVYAVLTNFQTGGAFTLAADDGVNPPVSVGPIDWNATALQVQAAFTAAGVTTTCAGGPLDGVDSVLVEFTGAFGQKPIGLTVSNDSTTGPGGPVEANEATPGGPSNPPICKTGVLNGKRVVRFDANSAPQYLELTGDGLDLLRATDGFTILAACANIPDSAECFLLAATDDAVPTNIRAKLSLLAATGGPLNFACDNEDGENGRASHTVVDVMTGADADGFSGSVVVVATADFAQGSLLTASSQYGDYQSSLPDFTALTRGPTPDTASLAIIVGADSDSQTGGFGDLAELLVFQRALNAMERRQMIEYLSAKWATL